MFQTYARSLRKGQKPKAYIDLPKQKLEVGGFGPLYHLQITIYIRNLIMFLFLDYTKFKILIYTYILISKKNK